MTARILGFVGLGVMGEPMCRNLRQRSACRVIAFDLDPAPLLRLAQHGVEPAGDAAGVAKASDVVFVSLPSGRVLADLARGADGLLAHARPGQLIVDLGTSPVALTRELAAEFDARGARYLDAPVARTRQAAEAGTLSIMVGGDAAVLAEISALLACMASDVTHCGPTGSGQMTKILNNMVLFQTVAALSEAYAIAKRAGFDPQVIFETLTKGSGDSFALRNHGAKAILPQVFPERAFSVEYAKKDLAYALDLAQAHRVDARGAQRVDELFDRAIAKGYGDQYFPVISRLLDTPD